MTVLFRFMYRDELVGQFRDQATIPNPGSYSSNSIAIFFTIAKVSEFWNCLGQVKNCLRQGKWTQLNEKVWILPRKWPIKFRVSNVILCLVKGLGENYIEVNEAISNQCEEDEKLDEIIRSFCRGIDGNHASSVQAGRSIGYSIVVADTDDKVEKWIRSTLQDSGQYRILVCVCGMCCFALHAWCAGYNCPSGWDAKHSSSRIDCITWGTSL